MDCDVGENDFLKEQGMALLESFVDPVVIYHPKGHTVPRIGQFFLSLLKAYGFNVSRHCINLR